MYHASRSVGAILLAGLWLLAPPARARTVYVNASAGSDTTGDGSAANPWRTFTHALGQGLVEGDEIHAARGVHEPAIGEVLPIRIPQGITVLGNGGGGTVIRAGSPPWPTELVRAAVGTAVLPNPSAIEWLELEGPGQGAGTTGLLLEANKGQGPFVRHLRLANFDRGIAVDYEVVSGPDQQVDSRPFIDGNTFTRNTVAVDIRIAVTNTLGRVRERSEILNNFIFGNDTAIRIRAFCSGCEQVDLGNTILNNTVALNRGDALVLTNSDCSQQLATVSPQAQNNIFAFNGGMGLNIDPCATPNTIDTNLFWQNTLGGDGDPQLNLIEDPILVDLITPDLHLRPGSPCIDSGLDFIDVPDDWDGDLRPADGDGDGTPVTDIGADELVLPPISLRRGNFLSLDPLTPARGAVFPMFPANPLTVLVTNQLATGTRDTPGLLTDTRIPLAFYQHDDTTPQVLHCLKDRVDVTVAFELR